MAKNSPNSIFSKVLMALVLIFAISYCSFYWAGKTAISRFESLSVLSAINSELASHGWHLEYQMIHLTFNLHIEIYGLRIKHKDQKNLVYNARQTAIELGYWRLLKGLIKQKLTGVMTTQDSLTKSACLIELDLHALAQEQIQVELQLTLNKLPIKFLAPLFERELATVPIVNFEGYIDATGPISIRQDKFNAKIETKFRELALEFKLPFKGKYNFQDTRAEFNLVNDGAWFLTEPINLQSNDARISITIKKPQPASPPHISWQER